MVPAIVACRVTRSPGYSPACQIASLLVSSNVVPQQPFRLIVTGGGTGGHTYPALTAVRAMRTRFALEDKPLDVLWIGAENSLESRVAASEGIDFRAVATGKIRRSSNPLKLISRANVRDMGRVPLGVAQARSV